MVPVQYTYHAATSADIPRLIQVGLESYGLYLPFMTVEDGEKMKANISNPAMWTGILDKAAGFVALSGNQVVGMAFLTASGNPWEMFPADWSYIRMVGVLPAHHGHGIAARLMQLCVDHARATGEKVIALHTSEHMHAARHIYEKMGFTILKEIPPRLGMRYWVYTLQL